MFNAGKWRYMVGSVKPEDIADLRWRNLLQLRAVNEVCFGVGVGAMLIRGFL